MKLLIRVISLFLFITFDVKANNNDLVFTPINVSNGLSDNQVRYILQLSDGRMVFTTNGNLNIYDGSHFKYVHRTSQHVYPLAKYNGFYRIYQEGDSLLWIKDNHKLMCVNLRQEKYIENLDAYLTRRNIQNPIDDIFLDSQNRLWLLCLDELRCNNTSEKFDIGDNKDDLQDLATDKNNLYLFYDSGEIVCYDLKTKNKLYNKAAYSPSEQSLFFHTSLIVPGCDGFYQLRNGSKGGFFFFDTQKLVWKKILETDYNLNTLVIKDETAYISCLTGIWIINCRSGEKEYLPTLKTIDGNIINTEISTLFYDKQDGFWLGTLNRGLLYYHPSRYKFSCIGRLYFPENFTRDVIVQAFAEDEIGNIYVKCSSGIYQYHPKNKDNALTLVSPSVLPENISERLNSKRQFIFEDKKYTALHTDIRGWIWAGTEDGLKLFKQRGQEEQIFYTEDGLSNNFVHAILEDRNHSLWITTSYGISKVLVDSVNEKIRFINFNTYDGTLTGEYSDGAAFEAADGTLYFGGIDGFNILNPDHVPAVQIPFKPVFTNLYLRGDKVETGKPYDGHVILPEAAPYVEEIELSHNQNFLTFEFSAVNYRNPLQTRYRYQLKGIDTDCRETYMSGQHPEADGILRASYTNLPHGKYILWVTASADGQQWNDIVTELKIIIRAPWWKTTTAYILYLLSFVMVVSLCVWLYIHITRKRMKRLHEEKILLLRIQNLIEQNRLLEEEKEFYYSKKETEETIQENSNNLSTADAEFLTQAMKLVEENLNEPDYSVEMLSRDLCMDRTGLYRKLIGLLDKSPSLFIRNIRLQKAAQLILEDKFTIAEIAEKVGFSSSSYLSKCFQEVYGCRPSEYTGKMKKST